MSAPDMDRRPDETDAEYLRRFVPWLAAVHGDLPRPFLEDIDTAIEAIIAGDVPDVWGEPLWCVCNPSSPVDGECADCRKPVAT